MNIIFPSNTTEQIDAMRNAIGRPVTFYVAHRERCYNCGLDPITDTSTNSFCPVCSGTAYISTYSGIVISGHITHSPSETVFGTSAGNLIEGDVRVQIKYTPENMLVLEEASYAEVDSKPYSIKKKTKRGFPDINRVLVDMIERTNNG